MPTRIVLKETPRRAAQQRMNHGGSGLDRASDHPLSPDEEAMIRQAAGGIAGAGGGGFTTPPRTSVTTPNRRASSSHQRKALGFRSSILREYSSRNQFAEDGSNGGGRMRMMDGSVTSQGEIDEAAEQRRLQLHLSNEDIRASPRLLGYLFGSIGTCLTLLTRRNFVSFILSKLIRTHCISIPFKQYSIRGNAGQCGSILFSRRRTSPLRSTRIQYHQISTR